MPYETPPSHYQRVADQQRAGDLRAQIGDMNNRQRMQPGYQPSGFTFRGVVVVGTVAFIALSLFVHWKNERAARAPVQRDSVPGHNAAVWSGQEAQSALSQDLTVERLAPKTTAALQWNWSGTTEQAYVAVRAYIKSGTTQTGYTANFVDFGSEHSSGQCDKLSGGTVGVSCGIFYPLRLGARYLISVHRLNLRTPRVWQASITYGGAQIIGTINAPTATSHPVDVRNFTHFDGATQCSKVPASSVVWGAAYADSGADTVGGNAYQVTSLHQAKCAGDKIRSASTDGSVQHVTASLG